MSENNKALEQYGWDDHFAGHFGEFKRTGYSAGRVASQIKNHYRLLTGEGEIPATCSGGMFHRATGKGDLPTVGDWVAFKTVEAGEKMARIQHVLPRKSKFSRKVVGKTVMEQPVAANVDTVFLMSSLDGEYNLRRIERYLTMTWESGSQPVVLLNKADICDDVEEYQREAEEVVIGVPVHVISALRSTGLEQLAHYLERGMTVAMLGSSGVGKSTLLNTLMGEELQRVDEMGVIGKGKHTTRRRELFILPSGAMMIDTPGMREIQLWNAEEGLVDTFLEIEEIGRNCRFSDCRHQDEPDCAVKAAVEEGTIPRKRYENFLKMQGELEYLDSKQDHKAMLERKAKDKRLAKLIKKIKNH